VPYINNDFPSASTTTIPQNLAGAQEGETAIQNQRGYVLPVRQHSRKA